MGRSRTPWRAGTPAPPAPSAPPPHKWGGADLPLAPGVGAQGVGAARPAQLFKRGSLQLAHRFAARPQPARNFVERALVAVGEAEPELDHPALTRREGA